MSAEHQGESVHNNAIPEKVEGYRRDLKFYDKQMSLYVNPNRIPAQLKLERKLIEQHIDHLSETLDG